MPPHRVPAGRGDHLPVELDRVAHAFDVVVGAGLEFLILAPDGRIRLDYQFIEL
jgi:hypothetical protein